MGGKREREKEEGVQLEDMAQAGKARASSYSASNWKRYRKLHRGSRHPLALAILVFLPMSIIVSIKRISVFLWGLCRGAFSSRT